jgi:hypothetical protein
LPWKNPHHEDAKSAYQPGARATGFDPAERRFHHKDAKSAKEEDHEPDPGSPSPQGSVHFEHRVGHQLDDLLNLLPCFFVFSALCALCVLAVKFFPSRSYGLRGEVFSVPAAPATGNGR